MYYSRKQEEPVEDVETSIWTCTKDDCICWMRENLSFDEIPVCPICSSSMVKDSKMLPPIA
ncbi:cold-shock protein [Brevibacillus laterosporus]|uniref:Cold-shock protein n=1 Tax=Brevibacillus laterosporus TaxID=1465 RepID=A0A0F7EJX3_BRELA|nr:cold-shock protein [Brevibacillus laterosporus]AKF95917.1 cold-shock protein [Brevibacillus laterosporus]